MPTIFQTGPNSWRCTVRLKGHPVINKTFPSEKEAQKFGRDTERSLRAGVKYNNKGGPTVGQLVTAFREVRAAGSRPIGDKTTEHYYLKVLVRLLGDVPIESCTPERLAQYCKTRLFEQVKPSTVLEELNKLSTVIRHAAPKVGRVLPDVVNEARPFLRYNGLIAAAAERDRRPSQQELDAILERLDPRMQDVVRFAVATAMRRGEICRVQWDGLDEATRCLLITDRKDPRAKAGNDGVIPLLSVTGYDAWEIVQRQSRDQSRIFPLSGESISDAFLLACRAAQVEDLHFHDLRHEGISRMFEAGMTIEEVAVVSGHKDWRHLKRYLQLKPESLHDIGRGTQRRREHPKTASPHPDTSAA